MTHPAFLLPLPSWHSIISVTGSIAAFTFQIGSVSLIAFRASGLTREDTRLRGMSLIAPAAFGDDDARGDDARDDTVSTDLTSG